MEIKKIAHLKGHAAGVFALEQGSEPYLFYSGSSDKMLAEWSLEDFFPQKFSVNAGAYIYAICHIPEKQLLIIGEFAGGIHIVDLNKKQEIKYFTFHRQAIFDIKYSAKNESIYALSGDGSFSVWNINDFKLTNHISLCNEKLRSIDFNKEESLAAIACGDGAIRIFDASKNSQLQEINAHQLSANAVKFHPNGTTLVSGGRDAHLRFWNINENFKMLGEIPAHNYAIYDITFSPSGEYCATASRDKTAKIWNANNFEMAARLDKKNFDGHTHSVNKLLWSSYKNYLVSASDDRTIIVWEVK